MTFQMALIGLGRMGRVHAQAISTLDRITVTAIAEPSKDGQEFARKMFPMAAIYDDYLDAIKHKGLHGCIIASPTHLHPRMVSDALNAGLNVLCEKPLSLDPLQAIQLSERAKLVNRVLQVGHWRRFSPPWAEAKRLLDSGAIGNALLIRLSQWDANPPPASFCDVSTSGGLAIDCGVHEYDLAEWFFGMPVRSVRAWNLPLVDSSLSQVGDVDNLCAVLEFDGDRLAFVDLSRNCRYGDDVRTEILGSQGALFIDLFPIGRTRLATANGIKVVDSSIAADATLAGVTLQAAAFVGFSLGDTIAIPDASASARSVLIGHGVALAAKNGLRVEI